MFILSLDKKYNKAMQRNFKTYRWLVAAWLLLGCTMLCSAVTYDSPSASWGYAPTYQTAASPITVRFSNATVMSCGSGGDVYTTARRGSSSVTNRDVYPSYNFQSTSAYKSLISSSKNYAPTESADVAARRIIRRTGSWDGPSDEDDPIGVVPSVPVGEPLILLVLAIGYCFWLRLRRLKRQQ